MFFTSKLNPITSMIEVSQKYCAHILLTVQGADLSCIKYEKVEQSKHFELLKEDEIHSPLWPSSSELTPSTPNLECISHHLHSFYDPYNVRMIDFSYLCPIRDGCNDGYIKGLNNLLSWPISNISTLSMHS
ncbi:hypothetical protein PROFUN_05762 [Planoprotostelium fungivorum]|uniref:Uncharacterized protein n=1 Tax=Planoprotostelium fungivorum TaxID=1890364 RepID=A0A2P6NPU6_9EUKA|nr:hypothetical protein PROFUN_05762 [Planoprotostelium fungivorum]